MERQIAFILALHFSLVAHAALFSLAPGRLHESHARGEVRGHAESGFTIVPAGRINMRVVTASDRSLAAVPTVSQKHVAAVASANAQALARSAVQDDEAAIAHAADASLATSPRLLRGPVFSDDLAALVSSAPIVVCYTVEPSGRTSGFELLRGFNPTLLAVATNAFSSVLYVPARRNGSPVPARTCIDIGLQSNMTSESHLLLPTTSFLAGGR